MIGNDVVDLASRESREIHPRFDTLAMTARERRLLVTSRDPHTLRWQLWSAKEAAYKLLKRQYPHTSFVPRRYQVSPEISDAVAQVHHGRHRVRVAWRFTQQAVHAVARPATCPDARETVIAAVCTVDPASPQAEGVLARQLALQSIAAAIGTPQEELSIRCEGRIPDLVTTTGKRMGFLSLSHHGRYVAFACRLHAGVENMLTSGDPGSAPLHRYIA